MKKILVLLLSVYGCIASAQKNPPVTKAWAAPTPVTNAGVANGLAAQAPVTNEWATHALIMNALATNTLITHASVTNEPAADVPVANAPAARLPAPPALISQPPVANALITPVIATNALVTDALVAKVPTIDTPATNLPAAKELMAHTLVVSAPVTNAPVSIAPVTNMPVLNTAVAHPAATNAPARPVALDIISDSWDFDQNMRQTVYHGHVRVTDDQMRLVCEQLTAIFPENNGRHLERVLAETNVVIDFTDEQGEKYHVTAAKAVYVYNVVNATTNEIVTLTGSPKVQWGATDPLTGESMNSLTGEPIFYTRVNKQKGSFHATNQVLHFVQPPTGTNTDAAPVKLF
jgi:lipopolysaccharide export system protein LptA